MKTIVVYYSMEGNTDYAAGRIAEELSADMLRIHPKKEYPHSGFRKFLWGGKSAVMAETPALEPYAFDAPAYDCVVLGFPVWAGNVAPPLRTFLRENDLTGKRVAAFACQSGNGAERAFGKLRDCLGGAELATTLVLIDPKDKPDPGNADKIRDFCRSLDAR